MPRKLQVIFWVISVLVGLASVLLSVSILGLFIACGDSMTGCRPSDDLVNLFKFVTFPMSSLPKSIAGFFGPYLYFILSGVFWGSLCYLLLNILRLIIAHIFQIVK